MKPTETHLTWQTPWIYQITSQEEFDGLKAHIENFDTVQFFDPMHYAVHELYDIEYPSEKDLPDDEKTHLKAFAEAFSWPHGTFVYYPWEHVLVRFPSKDQLRALRTSRNRNLIMADEQKKLYDATIFVAGLSVGSSIVEALVASGIGGKLIVADLDIIEPSNLNRIKSPYHHVGTHKADAVAMRMSQIDPFLEIVLYRDGLTKENLTEILEEHKPDIIVDEMDQLPLKVTMRRQAKKYRIPVLSAADDGDSTLIDIERYDLHADLPLYHGTIPQDVLDHLEQAPEIPRAELGMLIGKYFIGPDHIPLRMFQSLAEVGKTLPSWPQLGSAATQSGLAVAYAARRIILGQQLAEGRFVIGPDQIINPELHDPEHLAQLEHIKESLNGPKPSAD